MHGGSPIIRLLSALMSLAFGFEFASWFIFIAGGLTIALVIQRLEKGKNLLPAESSPFKSPSYMLPALRFLMTTASSERG